MKAHLISSNDNWDNKRQKKGFELSASLGPEINPDLCWKNLFLPLAFEDGLMVQMFALKPRLEAGAVVVPGTVQSCGDLMWVFVGHVPFET